MTLPTTISQTSSLDQLHTDLETWQTQLADLRLLVEGLNNTEIGKPGVIAAKLRALFLATSDALRHWQERAGVVTATQLIESRMSKKVRFAGSMMIGPANSLCPKCAGKRRLERLLFLPDDVHADITVCLSCGHSEWVK